MTLSTPVAESTTRLTTSIAVPTGSLCQLAVRSGVVNARDSTFHHTVTPGQAKKWLFRNKAQLNPQVFGRILDSLTFFSNVISVNHS